MMDLYDDTHLHTRTGKALKASDVRAGGERLHSWAYDTDQAVPVGELVYTPTYTSGAVCTPYWRIMARRPFAVDGITYTEHVDHHRPVMLQTFDDDGGSGAIMRCSHPPTEKELDRWVREGLIR